MGRLATVDLGTNTVRLLVVEPDGPAWRTLQQSQRVTRLGEGQGDSGRLGPEPMRRTSATVAEFARAARALGAGRVRIVATSAVREAANREEFVARLERESGERVEVVSGEEEARLTLKGVTSGLPGLGGSFVLFDIGGGSTEFVLARGGTAAAAVSLRLGVVALQEEWGEPGPVRAEHFARLRRHVERRLAAEVPEAIAARLSRSWSEPRAPSPRWPRSSSGSAPTTRRPSTATASSGPRWSGSSRGWARSGWRRAASFRVSSRAAPT